MLQRRQEGASGPQHQHQCPMTGTCTLGGWMQLCKKGLYDCAEHPPPQAGVIKCWLWSHLPNMFLGASPYPPSPFLGSAHCVPFALETS